MQHKEILYIPLKMCNSLGEFIYLFDKLNSENEVQKSEKFRNIRSLVSEWQ